MMIRDLRSPALLLPLLLAACGGPAADAKEPSGVPSATPSAEPTAKASDAPAAPPSAAPAESSAAPAPDAAPKAKASPDDSDGPDGIRRWASWTGPKTGAAITAKRVWAVIPNRMGEDAESFGSVALTGPFDVLKANPGEVAFEMRKHKYAVPLALARAAQAPKGLARGAAVRCAFGGNSAVAYVDAVSPKEVVCSFRFMKNTRKEKVKPEEVYPLSGKLDLGAPAVVRFESDPEARYLGTVLAVSGDDTWVSVDTQFVTKGDPRADHFVHKVKTANVEVINLAKPLKVGDACLATSIAQMEPCHVSKVLDGGIGYVVTFEAGKIGSAEEWELGEVAPLPAAKK